MRVGSLRRLARILVLLVQYKTQPVARRLPDWATRHTPGGDSKDYLCAARPDLLQFLVQVKVIILLSLLAQFVDLLLDYRRGKNKLAKSIEVDPLQMMAIWSLERFVLLQDRLAASGTVEPFKR